MRKGSKRRSITENEQQQFVKEGHLLKLSHGRLKRWQKRYFVLSGHYLKYYSSANTSSESVKGAIDIREVTSCTPSEHDEMVLVHRDGSIFKVLFSPCPFTH
jgi:hypothetical protein